MGTFKLGRVGLETTAGEVHGWRSSDRGITASGHTEYGSVAEALVVREQILGYAELADEDFVPVVWSEQPEVNGFYRVTGVNVTSDVDKAVFGVLDWTVDLERVQGFSAPLLEDVVIGVPRPGSTTVVAEKTVSVPAAARSFVNYSPSLSTYIPFEPEFTRVGEGGVEVNVYPGISSDPQFISQFYVDPEHHYDGAATTRVNERIVVGRQPRNNPQSWEISNGLFRARAGESTAFVVEYSMWDETAGAWSDWRSLTMMSQNFSDPVTDMNAPHTITIMRNSAEVVTLRVLSTTAGSYAPVMVDLTLRRGSRSVDVYLSSVFTSQFKMRLSDFGSPTTDATGTIYRTTAGIATFVAAPYAITFSGGRIMPYESAATSVTEWAFAFGMVNATGFASVADAIYRAAQEYMWAPSEKLTVVAQ